MAGPDKSFRANVLSASVHPADLAFYGLLGTSGAGTFTVAAADAGTPVVSWLIPFVANRVVVGRDVRVNVTVAGEGEGSRFEGQRVKISIPGVGECLTPPTNKHGQTFCTFKPVTAGMFTISYEFAGDPARTPALLPGTQTGTRTVLAYPAIH